MITFIVDVLLSVVMIFSLFTNGLNTAGSQVMITGIMLNDLVYVSNGFKMPVFDNLNDPAAFNYDHMAGTSNSMYPFLGDWVLVDIPFTQYGAYFSPGDLITLFGFFLNTFGSK